MSAQLVLVMCAPIAALALAACSDLPISRTEQVYQVANALDWAETINVARRPDCYAEGGWPTKSIIGAHPSVGSVVIFGAAQAVLHALVSTWLDREGWARTLAVWQASTISIESYDVVHNTRMGLRPFASGSDCHGPGEPL